MLNDIKSLWPFYKTVWSRLFTSTSIY